MPPQDSLCRAFKPCTLRAVSLLWIPFLSSPQDSSMILPLRITTVPVACSHVYVLPLVSSVSVQPSTATAEPSEVTALTWMVSLLGLKMSDAPPSIKGACGFSGTVFPFSSSTSIFFKNGFLQAETDTKSTAKTKTIFFIF